MSQQPTPDGNRPDEKPSRVKTEAEIAEAKRLDKARTVCHSHHVAGTEPPPAPEDRARPAGR